MTRPRPAPIRLHSLTVLECGCCAMTTEFILTSLSDQRVCDPCKRHWGTSGSKTTQRERDHRIWWRERLGAVEGELSNQQVRFEHRMSKVVADAEATEQRLRSDIENLHHEVDHVTRGRISEDAHRADRKRAGSGRKGCEQPRLYRSRGRAYSVLWELMQMHFGDPGPGTECECGEPTAKCRTWQLLEDIEPTIRRWEFRQVERMNRELPHELPDSHPDVQRTGRDSVWQRDRFGHLPDLSA